MLSSRSLLATSLCVLSISISSPLAVEGRGQFLDSRDLSTIEDSMMFSHFNQELAIPMAGPCEGLEASKAQDWVTCAKNIGNEHVTLPPNLTAVLKVAHAMPELMTALQTALNAAAVGGGPMAHFAINFVFALAEKAASNNGVISVKDIIHVAATSTIPGGIQKFIPGAKWLDWLKANGKRVLPRSNGRSVQSKLKSRSTPKKPRPARRASEVADADEFEYEPESIRPSSPSPSTYEIDDQFSEVFEELETIRELLREIKKTSRHQYQIAREEEEEEVEREF
jgi:hypothetical protein